MYNDDLEEDNSDYVEGEGDDGEGEEEEEDVDSDELDESGAGAPAAANNQAPADQPAEGNLPAISSIIHKLFLEFPKLLFLPLNK